MHHHFFFCIPIAIIIIGLIIFWIRSRRNRFNRGDINHILEAERILKQRLAKGEITEAEYERLKDVISK